MLGWGWPGLDMSLLEIVGCCQKSAQLQLKRTLEYCFQLALVKFESKYMGYTENFIA